MAKNKDHHNVYVIKLLPAVVKSRKFCAENKGFNPFLTCYYVGMTGLTPEERFENHKKDYKSSWIVHRYGECLVPEIYERFNPMPYYKAVKVEKALAAALRRRGHGVWQN
ncbi:MAG: hypothetical protein JW712_13195 [Dehalococcoidales bacterium]|nr:hypothetical protein [Dehalococcoidales bacterium]